MVASGAVGSGKTTYLVDRVIRPLVEAKTPRIIYTNIDLAGALADNPNIHKFIDLFSIIPLVGKDGKLIPSSTRSPSGAVFVIDEGGVVLMSGISDLVDKHKYINFRSWLAQHRHFTDDKNRSSDIWVACQDTSQLTNQLRLLVDYTIYFSSVKRLLGLKLGAEVRIYNRAVSADYLGSKKSPNVLKRFIYMPRKSSLSMFNSHDGGVLGVEQNLAPPILLGKIFLLIVILSLSVGTLLRFTNSAPLGESHNEKNINDSSLYSLAGIRVIGNNSTLCFRDRDKAGLECKHYIQDKDNQSTSPESHSFR